jgi:ASC-1-like (ASCH) protein
MASNKYEAYLAIRGGGKTKEDKSAKIKPGDFVIFKGFWNGLKFYVHSVKLRLKAEDLMEVHG